MHFSGDGENDGGGSGSGNKRSAESKENANPSKRPSSKKPKTVEISLENAPTDGKLRFRNQPDLRFTVFAAFKKNCTKLPTTAVCKSHIKLRKISMLAKVYQLPIGLISNLSAFFPRVN